MLGTKKIEVRCSKKVSRWHQFMKNYGKSEGKGIEEMVVLWFQHFTCHFSTLTS